MIAKNKIGRQITVAEMAPHVHSFLAGENKVNKISEEKLGYLIPNMENIHE